MARRNTPYTDEELAACEPFFEDGASYAEVSRTSGISKDTLRKYFPGYGWSPQQRGAWSRIVTRANERIAA